jgi:hypothetical protein
MRTLLPLLVCASLSPSLGCTGLSLGEQAPGDGIHSWLEGGAIAVDPRTETSFVLSMSPDGGRQRLFAVGADADVATPVADLSGFVEARLLFPSSGLLLMAQEGGAEWMRVLDPTTFAVRREARAPVLYAGTRLSPSGRWLAVADTSHERGPIHLIDTATLDIHAIPHGGDWLEAMWLHESDRLLAIVFYRQQTQAPSARILSWSLPGVAQAGFAATPEGYWPSPDVDVEVPGASYDLLFSFTWVGVSPDDRTAVFPVLRQGSTSGYQLLVLDLASGALRTVDDAKGPVGFTPDSSSIVSYRDEGAGARSDLLVIDRVTLATNDVPLPIDGIGPSYFVSHEGNFVVVAPTLGLSRLVLYDVDHQRLTELRGPSIQLDEFVSRPGHGELWLVDRGLFRLDFHALSLEPIALDWTPSHINLLPRHDQLVLDDGAALSFFDPTTRRTVREVALPAP